MSEYYMKMKELTSRLKKDGYNITGRMIKHYIDIGILQKPEYTSKNQALYANFHYVRLKRILFDKKNGKSVSKIKDDIFKENDELLLKANRFGINNKDEVYLADKFGSTEQEEARILKKSINKNNTYSKIEILDKLDSDDSILDLGVDTGAIDDKEIYNDNDLYVLLCMKNLISVKKRNCNVGGQLVDRIGEISKINAVAKELSTYMKNDDVNSWLYTNLFDAIVMNKVEKDDEIIESEEQRQYNKALKELKIMTSQNN